MENESIIREYLHRSDVKYGCNPHQKTSSILTIKGYGMPFEIMNGNPGYINLLDALNSWQLVKELKEATQLPSAASFKHVSPAGAAVYVELTESEKEAYDVVGKNLSNLAVAYLRARNADPMSSFGDFMALSDEVDESTAQLIKVQVTDGIIAPGFSPAALEILKKKKNGAYTILKANIDYQPPEEEYREVFGLVLKQQRNNATYTEKSFTEIVTENKDLPPSVIRDLIVCTVALKYTQSNSVGYAVNGQVVCMGAGQQSRVDCVKLAGRKTKTWWLRQHPKVKALPLIKGTKNAQKTNARVQYIEGDMTDVEEKTWLTLFSSPPEPLTEEDRKQFLEELDGVSLSSDAFFPFRDSIDQASKYGVRYAAQPCGSIADEEVFAACNEYNMCMVKTEFRLFHH